MVNEELCVIFKLRAQSGTQQTSPKFSFEVYSWVILKFLIEA